MKTIDITQILSADLKSRARANDLKLFIDNCEERHVIIDFQKVQFATRSFMDEFYNLFLKDKENLPWTIEIINVPEDINCLLEIVSKTQSNVSTVPETAHVESFRSIKEFLEYMGALAF